MIKYPGVMKHSLAHDRVSNVLLIKIRKEWEKTRMQYVNEPKKIYDFYIYLGVEDPFVSAQLGTIGWIGLPITQLIRKIVKTGMVAINIVRISGTMRL